jgi:tetratricopeptide (TPR) repeat protein
MVDLVASDKESIVRFVDWLVAERAWTTVDALTARFAKEFDRHPVLLYTLAGARKAQGRTDLVDEAVAKAARIAPDDLGLHRTTAIELQELGLMEWAEREYRHVIAKGSVESPYVVDVTLRLADMLHDVERHLDAAKVQQVLVDAMQKTPRIAEIIQELRTTGGAKAVRARLEYFYACHDQKLGDVAKQTEHLDKAVEHDPTDADVLIALYRLPNPSPERKARTLAQIRSAARVFERQIEAAEDGDLARTLYYNQYAWLIANTEGDYDKALKYSLASVAVYPNAAGYIDTLARCYYAKGDLEAAVRTQTQANRLEPHSGAIARQLEFFRQELEAQRRRQAAEQKPPDARSPQERSPGEPGPNGP